MGPSYETVAARIDEIAAEMQALGLWRSAPLAPEKYQFQQAFGVDTMTFSEWLQFVFIPRVRGIIAARAPFPVRSMVGAQAVREFDGQEAATRLLALLADFDALFG